MWPRHILLRLSKVLGPTVKQGLAPVQLKGAVEKKAVLPNVCHRAFVEGLVALVDLLAEETDQRISTSFSLQPRFPSLVGWANASRHYSGVRS